jgi:DNA-binding response OmpR family regulator
MRVLLVDDDVTIGVMLSIGLPDLVLVEATSLADARAVLAADDARSIDAVVVDRRLADGDGLDLVREIRRTFTTSRTPIVVITAGHDEADRAAVLRAGADRYLAKPVDPDELVAHVSSVLAVAPADRRVNRAEAARGDVDVRAPDVDMRETGVPTRRPLLAWLRRRTG